MAHDAGEGGVAAEALSADVDGTAFDDGAGEDVGLCHFLLGNTFAGDRRFIHGSRTRDDDAVNRDPLSWPYAKSIPDLHMRKRHVFVVTILDTASRSRRSRARRRGR